MFFYAPGAPFNRKGINQPNMRIHTEFDIDGQPATGTFGDTGLEDLQLARDAGMNYVKAGKTFLDVSSPEGRFCQENNIRVMYSIAGHVHGSPRLSRPIGADDVELPIANGEPLPGPSVIQVDDELILYESDDRSHLTGCERGYRGTRACAHELSTILLWPDPLEKEIAEVKASPNLWGYWALDDTPGYALSAMRGLYAAVKRNDPGNHPVIAGHSGAATLRNFGPDTCDMIALYFYPFMAHGYDRTMNSYDTQWILTDARRRVPGIPFMGIYQGFWEPGDSTRRMNKLSPLTPAEIREQVEDFVREGASALCTYAIIGEETENFRGWNTRRDLVEELRSINDEIRQTGALEIGREPEEMAAARIQPRGFYVHAKEVQGIIPAWRIIGPFDACGGSIDSLFPPDSPVDLEAAYPGKELRASWRTYPSHAGAVGLGEIYGHHDYTSGCIAYASCEVMSPESMNVQLRFGSSDDGLVMINGREVHRYEGARGVHLDSDVVPVELEMGLNRVLVKVLNREGPWGFFLRFTDLDGKPLAGLRFSP